MKLKLPEMKSWLGGQNDTAITQPEKDLLAQAYNAIQDQVLDDLVVFAQGCADHAQSRGRSDVLLRIMEMRRKATQPKMEVVRE